MYSESFKNIIGYEGLYLINTDGLIKSVKRAGAKGGLIASFISNSGYPSVILSKGNKQKTFSVHSLVWDNFSEVKRNGRRLCIDHIDDNKLNSAFTNLQLLSQRDNLVKHHSRSGKLTGAHISRGKWHAQIGVGLKKIHLGFFETEIKAHEAYKNYKLVNSL